MNNIRILLLLFSFCWTAGQAQSVEGKWRTYDVSDPSRAEAIVEIFLYNDELYMKIDHIIPEEHRQDLCTKCDGEYKDKPILGMLIIRGARNKDGVWKGAPILNAKNGRWYGCQISLASANRLKVRGFIGHPWFGKNFYWDRVE